MPETSLQKLLVAIGAIAVAALVAFDVVTWGGGDARSAPFRPRRHERAPQTATVAAPVVQAPVIAATATGGDCWLSLHAGSPRGPVLYEGLLRAGHRVAFRKSRVWIRVGAAANLRLTVDGRAQALGSGTVEAVVTRAGLSG